MLGIILSQNGLENDLYWKDVKENPQTFTVNDFKEILKIISNRDTKLYYIEAQVKKEADLKLSSSSLQPFDLNSSWQNHEEVYSQS